MSLKNLPQVSVVMPVYNGEKYLPEAINSALNQTYENVELVAVDDGSTDDTIEILEDFQKKFGIVVVFHENQGHCGVSHSRKAGVDRARGKYIVFLDADDVFHPDKVAVQVEAMEATPNIVLCHTGVQINFEGDEQPISESQFDVSDGRYVYLLGEESYFLTSNFISNPTVMVRSDVLKGIEFFGQQLFQFEDWLMWILLSEKGPFLYLPEKLTIYRYHSDSATARVALNPLTWQYSRIELLISVYSRAKSSALRAATLGHLRSAIISLFIEYAAETSNANGDLNIAAADFAHKLFGEGTENVDEAIQRVWDIEHMAQYLSLGQLARAVAFKGAHRLRGRR